MPESRFGSSWSWNVLLLGVALPAFATASAKAPDSVGFVLEAVGKWQIASGGAPARPLQSGQAIKAGDQLLPGTPEARATVVLLDGSRLSCPSDPRCASPLAAGKAAKRGFARRLLSAIGGLFEQPERYAATMSRGEGLVEAVGIVNRERVHLGLAMSGMPAGPVPVSLQALDDAGQPTGAPVSVVMDPAGKGDKAMPVVKGLAPGLYRASLESGAEAWVYLAPVSRYRSAVSAFGQAHAIVNGWGSEVSERARRSFLRAALHDLARGKHS